MERVYIKDLAPKTRATVVGFLEKIRIQKTMIFLVLKDSTAMVQVAISKQDAPQLVELVVGLKKHSVLKVVGSVVEAPHVVLGQIEIVPSQIEVESEAETLPITEESMGTKQMEYRWIDLRSDKKLLIFKIRTFVESVIREWFVEREFLEIHTPKITSQSSEGGAEVFALDYYGEKAYLTQSPQFYKQMAMSAGFDKVFEIGAYYRAEKSVTPRHASETVCLDMEISGARQIEDIICLQEECFLFMLKRVKEKFGEIIEKEFGIQILDTQKIPRIEFCEVFDILKQHFGLEVPEDERLDLSPEIEELLCKYSKQEFGSDAVYVVHFPSEKRAFYTKRESEDAEFCESADLLYAGLEISSLAVREHDEKKLAKQIEEKGILQESMSEYLKFFRYGVPSHGGFGLGLDRLVFKLLGLQSIKESMFIFRGPSKILP